jgi:hypothetical protein
MADFYVSHTEQNDPSSAWVYIVNRSQSLTNDRERDAHVRQLAESQGYRAEVKSGVQYAGQCPRTGFPMYRVLIAFPWRL